MATFMLSAIVQKATGVKLSDYLKSRLFGPLGIRNFSWDETPEGYTFGATGLKLQSEDMAKFGQLLLQNRNWDGEQIIPQSWVEEATSFQIVSNDPLYFRGFHGKVAFIHLYHSFQGIVRIPVAHRLTDLMDHCPNRFVTF